MYQYGNSLDNFKFIFGKRRIPFALNIITLHGFYTNFEPWNLREPISNTASVIYDNQDNKSFDINFSMNNKTIIEKSKTTLTSISLRYHYDLPAINRSRLSFSLLSYANKKIKYSFGIINMNPEGSLFHFEYIKGYLNEADINSNYFYRLSYVSQLVHANKTLFQWDYASDKHRTLTLAREYYINKFFSYRFGIFNLRTIQIKQTNSTTLFIGIRVKT